MQPQERQQSLETFGRGPIFLSEALSRCPKKMWLYRPSADRWSIHEIILHLADSEAESYIRCRQFIAEPGLDAAAYDPAAWANMLGYFHQSTREALGLIVRLRRMTYQVLRYLPDGVWEHTANHSKKGTLTLDEWLKMQARHIPHHVEQIRQNHSLWLKTHQPRKPATHPAAPLEMKENVLAPFAQVMEFAD
ncbi:MAG TPA: DinB family protein [Candidatus Acidoferrales bacterium]|nr:DinB family protein [Candidatus Acidoferrales bacterium]